MFGLGSLISGGIKGAASIFGGMAASKALNEGYNKVYDNLNQQLRDNQDWYDRRYNEDATQRADAQRMLAMTNQAIKERNKAAAGTAAVMGGTEESLAATKAANASALADTAANIAIAGANRKDQVENRFIDTKSDLNKQLRDTTLSQAQAKAENIKKAVEGVGNAAGSIASMFG